MAKKARPIKTNVNIHYLIPLTLIEDQERSERREVEIISYNQGMIRCRAVEDADKYMIHSFWDEYFQWLIYTGHIIPLIEETPELPSSLNIIKNVIDDWNALDEAEYESAIFNHLYMLYGYEPDEFEYDILDTIIAVKNIKWLTN